MAAAVSGGAGQRGPFDEIEVQLCDRPSLSALCRESGSFHLDRCPLGCTINSVQMQKWHQPEGVSGAASESLSLPPIHRAAKPTTCEPVPQRAAVWVTSEERGGTHRSPFSLESTPECVFYPGFLDFFH